jgi:hypothetical protein
MRKQAEERLFELVHNKMGSFMELHDYDFSGDVSRPGSPTKKDLTQVLNSPSQYLMDLIAYLDTVTKSTLDELPMSVRSFVQFEAVYFISTTLMGLLTSDQCLKLSPGFIDGQLKLDVDYFVTFIRNLKDEKLLDPIEDVRQVMRLLQRDSDLEAYLDKRQRQKFYSRLPPKLTLGLLEKYRQGYHWAPVEPMQPPPASTGFFGSSAPKAKPMALTDEQKALNEWKVARKRAIDKVITTLKQEESSSTAKQ